MDCPKQRTLGGEKTLEGIGVHSGEPSALTMKPADSGGIRFRRTDLEGHPEVPADLEHVVGTDLGTSIGTGDVTVMTVEHVMAALSASCIDNAVLELTGPEPPILDGSFQGYFEAISEVGAVELDELTEILGVTKALTVNLGTGASYVVSPADDLRISATIDFEHATIGRQYGTFDVTEDAFRNEIAPARTFGFHRDAEELQARGLAKGASLENTVVLNDDGLMNDSLRFDDEFLRHKIGDLIGDLALAGGRVRGHVVSERPSHEGNIALAKALKDHTRKGGSKYPVDVARIMEYLPHRYPFLLVDRILEFESGERIVGIKNVTINEPFFQGHFPGHPSMPGVLIIEAMAQVGGLLLMDTVEDPKDKVVYFMSLDNVKWRKPVIPGDQLVFEVKMVQFRRNVCKIRGIGRVDDKVVAEADLMARIVDR